MTGQDLEPFRNIDEYIKNSLSLWCCSLLFRVLFYVWFFFFFPCFFFYDLQHVFTLWTQ